MKKVEDYYYELTNTQLWAAYQAGDVQAVEALVERLDGKPPVSCPNGRPAAELWADVLAGHIPPTFPHAN